MGKREERRWDLPLGPRVAEERRETKTERETGRETESERERKRQTDRER